MKHSTKGGPRMNVKKLKELIALSMLVFFVWEPNTAYTATPPSHLAQTDGASNTTASWIDTLNQSFKLKGYVRQETAYRVDESREWTKIKQQIFLTESTRLSDDLRLRSSQWIWYDAVYDVTDNFDESLKEDQRWHYELRETYLDYSYDAFDLRLGLQQVVWGDAVGLFFADVVNAKDLREFILPEFDQIRIPQWGMDLEWSSSPFHAEFVWMLPEFNRLGVTGSEFEFPLPIPDGFSAILNDPSDPPKSISNSEAGIRLSTLLSGWDMSAFYLYSWDKFPVLYRTIVGSTFIFRTRYERANFLGGSFSKTLGDFVLKGELLINPHQHLVTFDANNEDGIVQRNVIDYLIGLEHTLPGGVDANIQFMQRVIGNHADLMQEDAVRSHISLWLKREFLNGKVTPELLLITGLTEQDMLYRPEVTINLTDNMQTKIGADIFQGHPQGLFGRFDNSSRFYTEFTYYF